MKECNVEIWERFKNLTTLAVGWLIGVRIALDMSQKEFAEALGVSEAQVSRDEINEYHGITVDKVQRILETFNIRFKAEIDEPISRSRKDDEPFMFA